MKHISLITLLLFLPLFATCQQLLADVNIDYSKVQGSNNQVFTTLKKDLKEFINNTDWVQGKKLTMQERIKCSFGIIIEERISTDKFKATLLIQSSRPVYNSSYITPVLNYQDTDFTFNYLESENLVFNESRFSGKNLTDVIAYYIYMILGYDADTFSRYGGNEYFDKAQKIADNSINQGYNGWNTFDGPRTRGSLISDLINDKAKMLRNISYNYHRLGLDVMSSNELQAKTHIATYLMKLNEYSSNYQFYPLDLFLTAKREEIANIFSGGTPVTSMNISELKTLLQKINPINSNEYWNKIKN